MASPAVSHGRGQVPGEDERCLIAVRRHDPWEAVVGIAVGVLSLRRT